LAQTIKLRRGPVGNLPSVVTQQGELLLASGSVGNLSGPFLTMTGTNGTGASTIVGKIYQGTEAPNITSNSVLTGTPFYSTNTEALIRLNHAGNQTLDLTGNIEGNTIASVTINTLNGNVDVVGDISASNLELSGNADITGNITLGGNIILGDQDVDFVAFKADVSSSLIPDVTREFDLGTSSKEWRNIYVQTLNTSGSNIAGNVQITGTLDVDGQSTLASVNVQDLTSGRVVLAGTSGELEDSANLTFNGTLLTVTGNEQITGTLDVNNQATLASLNVEDLTSGRVLLAGTSGEVEDSANLTFNGTKLDLTGNVTASGGFHSDGLSTFNTANVENLTSGRVLLAGTGGLIQDSGNLTFNGTLLTTTGNQQITGTFNVDSQSTLASLNVEDLTSGRVVLAGTSGEIEDSANLTFNGTLLTLTGNQQITGTLDVNNQATLASLNVEDLTQGRVVIVGATGEIADDGGLTYNPSTDALTVAGDIAVNGGDITSTASTFNLLNATPTTVNAFGAATAINIGAAASTTTLAGDLQVNGNDIKSSTGATVVRLVGNDAVFEDDVFISGSLTLLGAATELIISSSTIELDDNVIRLNSFAPFQRYAGFEVIDSGSAGISASLQWDSQNDYWLIESSSKQSGKLIATTYGTFGSESSLTLNTIPKSTGDAAIGDSKLTDNGSNLIYDTDAFNVAATSGNTSIKGTVTLSAAGGSDAGTNSSAIVFRNSSDQIGYISTTETTDVLDGLLGYKASDGSLIFSTVIDGGTF
jgi:fibronectin-binding autotransporter adhesin